MRPILLFVASVMAAAAVNPAARAQSSIEWVDVHMHLVAPGGDLGAAARAMAAAMDQSGIRAGVVMPLPQIPGMRSIHDVRELQAALKPHRARLSYLGGGGSLNPMLVEAARKPAVDAGTLAKFERAANDILAAGALGFGEITAHHLSAAEGHPYEWIPADHPLLLRLADIAAERDVIIDFHLDAILKDMAPPPRFSNPPNPSVLRENLSAFERLLDHNPRARIVWAHAGSDPLAVVTPAFARQMLARHPNVYMSLRMPAGAQRPGLPPQFATTMRGTVNPTWIDLVNAFPDRFVMGGDQFIAAPDLRGQGPGLTFAQMSPLQRNLAKAFLLALPRDTARKVAVENAIRLYKLPIR